jgi:hypothetical protein
MRIRQNTFLTTRGIVLVGSLVSPAVIAMDSVPPSGGDFNDRLYLRRIQLTCKACGDENTGEPTDAANKRCIANMPIFCSDVLMGDVATAVYGDSKYYEYHNGNNFQQTEPIFNLTISESHFYIGRGCTYFTICSNSQDIHTYQNSPEDQTESIPREPRFPVRKHQL